jgi:hypothetical protein
MVPSAQQNGGHVNALAAGDDAHKEDQVQKVKCCYPVVVPSHEVTLLILVTGLFVFRTSGTPI